MEEHIIELYEYLKEKKYKDIAIYNLSKESQFFEYGIIVTASTILNNKKLADSLMQDFNMQDFPEGYNKGEWIVFDLDKVVIHAFIPQLREKYNLDKLWQSKKISF